MLNHSIPNKTIIIGAGGHAKVIIDMLRANPHVSIVGCIGQERGAAVLGIPVIGDDSSLPELLKQGIRHAFVAIGNNSTRRRLALYAENLGFELINAVSPQAYIAPSVVLGRGVAVMAGSIIQPDCRIGSYSIINTGATIDHDSVIGEACHIAPGSTLSGNVSVGDESFLGTGTVAIDGMHIGKGCMIGAGAVVIRAIPDHVLAVGVPAVIIRSMQTEERT